MRTPVARSEDDLLRYLVDRLAAQSGGSGSTNEGFVFVRPKDGVSDDAPRLAATWLGAAYTGQVVVMLPGLAGQHFQFNTAQYCPSGALIWRAPLSKNPPAGTAS